MREIFLQSQVLVPVGSLTTTQCDQIVYGTEQAYCLIAEMLNERSIILD